MSDVLEILKRGDNSLEALLRAVLLDSDNKVPAERLRIVGALSDGAIIESGSNANGEYVRFADGLQVCMSTISLTGLDVAPDEVVFQKSEYTPPAAFIGTYDVLIANATATNNDSAYQASEILGITFSGNAVLLYNTGNSGGHVHAGYAVRNGGPYYVLSATIRVVAIGKWK